MLRHKEVWAYAGAKFLTDPVWWLFLFWLPDFFSKTHGLNLGSFGVPLAIIYVASDMRLPVSGGWISSRLLARGVSLNASRKLTMLGCALLVVPVMFAARVVELWSAVLLLSLATAAHQSFLPPIFSPSHRTCFPARWWVPSWGSAAPLARWAAC